MKHSSYMANVKKYFECVHSSRKMISGVSLYGVKMNERASVLRHWLDSCNGKSILDIGCGDGSLVAESIIGVPAWIHFEDIVQQNVNRAIELLDGRAIRVDGEASDILSADESVKYDIVLLIGVTDYYSDWERIAIKAMGRAKSILILDFPKSNTIRMAVRRIWLRLHGVSVYGVNKKDLESFLKNISHLHSYSIKETTYNWMVMFQKSS